MRPSPALAAELRALADRLNHFLAVYDEGLQDGFDDPALSQSLDQVASVQVLKRELEEQLRAPDQLLVPHDTSSASTGGQPD